MSSLLIKGSWMFQTQLLPRTAQYMAFFNLQITLYYISFNQFITPAPLCQSVSLAACLSLSVSLSPWHYTVSPFLFRCWLEKEFRPGAAAVAQSLRHQSIQDVNQQKHRLAVGRYSVGERRPSVERGTDMRELGLYIKQKRRKLVMKAFQKVSNLLYCWHL